jgi:hypothetical protein
MVDEESVDEEHADSHPHDSDTIAETEPTPAPSVAQSARPNAGDKASRPLTLSEFCADPTGKEESRIAPMIPKYLMWALHAILNHDDLLDHKGRPRTSINKIAHAALDHGIARFERLPSLRTVCAARQAILLSASEDIIQFDQFQHLIQARHGKARLDIKSVNPKLKGKVTDIAVGLGLHSGPRADTGTVMALAIMAGIMDSPLLKDTCWPPLLEMEVEEFRRAVRQRVHYATDLQRRAESTPAPSGALPTWKGE